MTSTMTTNEAILGPESVEMMTVETRIPMGKSPPTRGSRTTHGGQREAALNEAAEAAEVVPIRAPTPVMIPGAKRIPLAQSSDRTLHGRCKKYYLNP